EEYERALVGSTTTETNQQAPIGFSQQEWNKMRNSNEGGQEPGEVLPPPQVSTKTVTPPKPPPGLLQVELPYESSLSVTGRKVIKLDIEETHISKQRADEIGSKQD